MIKTIPTTYNGIKFRSRLEARWAVFFDELGIKYLYEYEGFELENKEWYLPDFYLPEYGIYCEVKPSIIEVNENINTFNEFAKGRYWLLLLVGSPNVNTTYLFANSTINNVVPFVNLIADKYGKFWSSAYDFESKEDNFIDYNLFKKACSVSSLYIFY
jgi:hypothetical protein